MSQQVRILFAVFSLTWAVTAFGQNNLTAKVSNFQPSAAAADESDRARDGLLGPVRRVRTEVVKLFAASGKTVEDSKRVLLENAEYDLKGTKTQNQYFPIAGATLTGREVYKYDERGNISEMTLVNTDGSLVSKEAYKYEYDSVGNWIKMVTSVAVVENSKIEFEPTEATYRTIFYYLDANMARMLQPSASPSVSAGPGTTNEARQQKSSLPSVNEVKAPASLNLSANGAPKETKSATALPPSTSLDKLNVSPIQPLVGDLRGGEVNRKVEITENEAPPPRPLLKPVSGGVLNGMALSLPAPVYPEVARRMHVSGLVEVEVVLDETGKVISARALSGPSTLRDAAVQAASHARFSPTKLSGMPVKVSGRINYNFTIPQ